MPESQNHTQPLLQSRHAPLALAVVALCLAGLLGLFLLLKDNYQVLEKGQLLPYTAGFIYKVRFFDRVTLLLEPECRPSVDILNTFLLVGVAAMSLVFALVVGRAAGRRNQRLFWMFALLFLGANYLAADEILGIHESIGHNLRFLVSIPYVERPDDFLVISYAIPTLLFAYAFRREFLASRRALWAMLLAVLLFVLSALSDLMGGSLEELFEIAGAVSLVLAILIVGLHHLSGLIAAGAGAEAAGATPGR